MKRLFTKVSSLISIIVLLVLVSSIPAYGFVLEEESGDAHFTVDLDSSIYQIKEGIEFDVFMILYEGFFEPGKHYDIKLKNYINYSQEDEKTSISSLDLSGEHYNQNMISDTPIYTTPGVHAIEAWLETGERVFYLIIATEKDIEFEDDRQFEDQEEFLDAVEKYTDLDREDIDMNAHTENSNNNNPSSEYNFIMGFILVVIVYSIYKRKRE